jgi:malto-oligosyltrehalose synthase/4-alpha-glucanotransferase
MEKYNPVSTYRIQFNKNFGLKELKKIIPYLDKTGVGCIYASPILQAATGSLHGYDVTDPTRINKEIGTEKELEALISKLKRRGIGWIQDIVPNHMAFTPENPWINDLLKKGSESRYYTYFDLLHDHPGKEKPAKLLLPFFGKAADEMLRDKELQVARGPGRPVLRYYETNYPLSDASISHIFGVGSDTMPDDRSIASVNRDPGKLKELLELQYYEPVHWKETEQRAGYRRFFTINGLICLQIQEKEVFHAWHAKLLEWYREGMISGLRVDHIDGLYDPKNYLEMLRSSTDRGLYLVVEKILEEGEKLPEDWPVEGTTGYDFLGMVNNLLTNETNETQFSAFTREWSDDVGSYKELSLKKKRFILHHRLMGELEFLAMKAARLLPQHNSTAGLALLKKAIGEFLVHCPVYKIYNPPSEFNDRDIALTGRIFDNAINDQQEIAPVLEELRGLFSIQNIHAKANSKETDDLFMRCMQFTGPLMAKGIEDTLFYSYNPFIAHNEVGDSPGYFGIGADSFHQAMELRLRDTPLTMNATSTHDTKRGADARARLNVLSDIPGEWMNATLGWRKINNRFKSSYNGKAVPTRNDEYFIYQSLFAHLPMEPEVDEAFIERFREFIIKALREAKVHSSWSEPDTEYEQGTVRFIESILAPGTEFIDSLTKLVKRAVPHGINNSLTQLILRNTVPGVPDHFQGSETWNLDFVDPDNRKEVNYSKLSRNLNRMLKEASADPAALLEKLVSNPADGRIKQWVNHKTLHVRSLHKELFEKGDYRPLEVEGAHKRHVIAFSRQYHDEVIVVILPLNTATMDDYTNWGDTRVALPPLFPQRYRDVFTGRERKITGAIHISDAFTPAPFSVLQGIPNEPHRRAGILMHISSLPGAYGTGDFGPEAMKFVDFLEKSGQRYWQVLPLNALDRQTRYSPYSSSSAFAGSHLFIDPYKLEEMGLVAQGETDRMKVKGKSRANYSKAARAKAYYIEQAYKKFSRGEDAALMEEYAAFLEQEKYWLDDFALFICLKEQFKDQPWNSWPEAYRHRDMQALAEFSSMNEQKLDQIGFTQFLFSRQWQELKGYANERGIKIFGDIPIYVDFDSADVWANPGLFQLDEAGEMTGVAGVPPDYFNEDGQHWGMPLFNWEAMKKQPFDWWIRRIRKNLEIFDLLRLDHFRGFSAYWQIPADAETAKEGSWVKVPGEAFFDRVRKEFPGLPLVAEDLGMIDDAVYALRDRYALPGMKVVQFGFGAEAPFAEHHPLNIDWNSIAYTGTHDNNTLKGWYRKELDSETKKRISAYIGKKFRKREAHLEMIRIAYASKARLVIVPLQDWLGLDEESRMNFPSTVKGNWKWKLKNEEQLDNSLADKIGKFVKTFGRY